MVSTTHAPSIEYSPARSGITWAVWSGVIAMSSITFGLYWDISWHMTIGRDTFWTPAHLAIQFGGILAAITSIYLIFSATFGSDAAERSATVRVWGFRGPLGAFLTAWGGVTMVTSAPFDNWWHNSFGLDVEIMSPPHVVLGLGIFAVGAGSLLLLVSEMNRASGQRKRTLNRLFLFLCGIMVILHLILISEYCDPTMMHSAIFYRMMSFETPLLLVASARASGRRYGATIVAAIYMLFMLAGLWIFPIFPASPKLGPVFTNLTHMVPMAFPVLLIIPAFLLDTVLNTTEGKNAWWRAALAGTLFICGLLLAHWWWAEFMLTPTARNSVFGQNYFPYMVSPSQYHLAWEFQKYEATRRLLLMGMGIAWISAILSSRVGLVFGDLLTRLRR